MALFAGYYHLCSQSYKRWLLLLEPDLDRKPHMRRVMPWLHREKSELSGGIAPRRKYAFALRRPTLISQIRSSA